MLVYILRHGDAETRPGADGERHLTEKGVAQVTQGITVAKSQLGAKIGLIYSSPITRAQESARIASKVLGIKDYSVSNSLEPEGEANHVYDELLKPNRGKGLLLVSHQPLVSVLLSRLIGSINFAMPTGCIACVDINESSDHTSGALLFLLPPTA
jgi:phosphohistidine phosphatase